jgi:multiple sugar transport system substrate-binding protein
MLRVKGGSTVALAVALLLAGCGRSTDHGTTSPDTTQGIDSGPATGSITIWAQGAEADALPDLLKDFKTANPGVTVNVTAVPWSAAHDKYQSAIAAGTTPDIGQLGTTWMGEFGAAGAFATTPKGFDSTAFYPGSLDPTRVSGSTFGVPWYVDTPVLYYRTDLATRAGYTSPPKTWEDLRTMAEAMQRKAGAKWGIALGPKDFQGFLPWAWSNGASITNADGTKWTIDTPEMVQAVQAYQSFFTEGVANKAPSTDALAYDSDFVSGAVPMFFGGPAEVGNLAKAGGAGFADKYATAVRPAGKTATSFVGGGDLVVFKQSKNQSAAWKLIRYLSKPEVQAAWYQKTGDLPAIQAAWKLAPLNTDTKLAVFGEQLRSVKSPPPTISWTQVQSAGDSVMEKVNISGLSPAEAMKQLQSTANSIGTGS